MNLPEDRNQRIVSRLLEIHADLSTEKRMQRVIDKVLQSDGVAFQREHAIGLGDIPDFLVENCLVIKCKVRGAQKMDLHKQLRRYADYP